MQKEDYKLRLAMNWNSVYGELALVEESLTRIVWCSPKIVCTLPVLQTVIVYPYMQTVRVYPDMQTLWAYPGLQIVIVYPDM